MIDPVSAYRIAAAVAPVASAVINAGNQHALKGASVANQRIVRNEETVRKRMEELWPLRMPAQWDAQSPYSASTGMLTVLLNVTGISNAAARNEIIREEVASGLFRMFSQFSHEDRQCVFLNGGWDTEKRLSDPSLEALDAGFQGAYLVVSAHILERDVEISIAYRGGGKASQHVYMPVGNRFPLHTLVPGRAKRFGGKILELVKELEAAGRLNAEQKAILDKSPMWKTAIDNGRIDSIVDLLKEAGLCDVQFGSEFYVRAGRDDRDDSKVLAAIICLLTSTLVDADTLARQNQEPKPTPWLTSQIHEDLEPDAAAAFEAAQTGSISEARAFSEKLRREKETKDADARRATQQAANQRSDSNGKVKTYADIGATSALMVASVLVPGAHTLVVVATGARRLSGLFKRL